MSTLSSTTIADVLTRLSAIQSQLSPTTTVSLQQETELQSQLFKIALQQIEFQQALQQQQNGLQQQQNNFQLQQNDYESRCQLRDIAFEKRQLQFDNEKMQFETQKQQSMFSNYRFLIEDIVLDQSNHSTGGDEDQLLPITISATQTEDQSTVTATTTLTDLALTPQQLLQLQQSTEQIAVQFQAESFRLQSESFRLEQIQQQILTDKKQLKRVLKQLNEKSVQLDQYKSSLDEQQRAITQQQLEIDQQQQQQHELLEWAQSEKQKRQEQKLKQQQKQQQKQRSQQLATDLATNKANEVDQYWIKFDLEPLQKHFLDTTGWYARSNPADFMLNRVFPVFSGLLPTDMSNHKIFISSKDVLKADWVQVSGPGAEINSDTRMCDFLHPPTKHGDLFAVDQSTSSCGNQKYNYTIKIKWE